MAKINARLEAECKGNVILEFLWSNVLLLFMFLFRGCHMWINLLVYFQQFQYEKITYIDSIDLLLF